MARACLCEQVAHLCQQVWSTSTPPPPSGSLRRLSESLKNRRMSLSREEISRMTIKEEDIEAEAKKMDDDADSDSDDDGDLPDSGAADKA